MKRFITITFILLLCYSGWAEEKEQYTNRAINDSIHNTKFELNQIKKEIIQLSDEIQFVKKNIGNEQLEIKEYVHDKYGTLLDIYAIVGAILGFFLTIVVITYLVNLFVKNQTKKYFESNKWFLALEIEIDKQLEQSKLKTRMRINVLSENFIDDMQLYLTENEFSNVEYYSFAGIINEEEKVLSSNPHILIINNQNDQFGLKNIKCDSRSSILDIDIPIINLIKLIKAKYPKLAVFYFNDNAVKLPSELDDGLKSSFASSYASFYHNLLDLMRYKYLVIDQKEL